jgi:hypothetical protein
MNHTLVYIYNQLLYELIIKLTKYNIGTIYNQQLAKLLTLLLSAVMAHSPIAVRFNSNGYFRLKEITIG